MLYFIVKEKYIISNWSQLEDYSKQCHLSFEIVFARWKICPGNEKF